MFYKSTMLAAVATLAFTGAGCVPETPFEIPATLQNDTRIIDEQGREIILRGVNARVQGLFDVSFSDGREPLEDILEFSATDVQQLREIGFNFLRIPINWSGISPNPGQVNTAYITAILNLLDLCEASGIRVMLDMHQDAYSKEIGEDGAPLWAIVPAPDSVNEGGHIDNLLLLRTSVQTQNAFVSFWNNVEVEGQGLQDHFIDAMVAVATAVHEHPAYLGLDLYNEPWLHHANFLLGLSGASALTSDHLYQFYANAINQLRNAGHQKLLLIEPDVAKNYPATLNFSETIRPQYTALLPQNLPWSETNIGYAPHLYTSGFLGYSSLSGTESDIGLSLNNSLLEANSLASPLIIGEFGYSPQNSQTAAVSKRTYDYFDAHLIHSAQWVWKESSQDSWGFFDFDSNGTASLRTNFVAGISRAFPEAISGHIESTHFDTVSRELNITFTYAALDVPHFLSIPSQFVYPDGFTVECNGVAVSPQQEDDSRYSVSCGDNAGEVYSLRVVPL